jgi:preprotein translocase subunit SecE
MGRIQRKKSPGGKKRKKQQAESAAKVQSTKSGASGRQGTGSAGTSQSAKKSASVAMRKPSAASSPVAGKQPKESIFSKSIQFLREVKVELKKVAWPSRKQTLGSTAVVIALVMLISLFLGVVDMGLSTLIRFVLN